MTGIQGDIVDVRFGGWTVRCSSHADTITRAQAARMEDALNDVWLPIAMRHYEADYRPNYAMRKWGVPSFLVRFDMPPMTGSEFPGYYEVEANPAGFGIAGRLGVDVHGPIAHALRELGITEFEYGALHHRREQLQEHEAAMSHFEGKGVTPRPKNGHATDMPLWLRAGHEDIGDVHQVVERCLLLHQHGGGHKKYLVETSGAEMLSNCRIPFTDPRFKKGFVLKPWGGWGSRDVHMYSALKPWKRSADTASKVADEIDRIFDFRGTEGDYIVQPFLPPQHMGDSNFRNWRVFAVYTPDGYRVIGGFWNMRNSIKLHGASDTIWGPVHVE